jgi:GTP-binding protein Era
VSITSAVPQTTRNAVRGIVNREQGQIVLVDTPGRHESERKLNRKLRDLSDRALNDADLVLYLLDVSRPPGPEEEAVAARLVPLGDRVVAAVNKIDLPGAALPLFQGFLKSRLPAIPGENIFGISARTGEGAGALLNRLFDLAPPGPALYDGDRYTDQDVPFRIAEIIREQAINRLRQELPHALYVEVADTELRDGGRRLWIRAFIITERESQKGMVVGKGGAMIKAIRQGAQKELARIFDWKIELDLRVKSSRDWRHNDLVLKRLTGG